MSKINTRLYYRIIKRVIDIIFTIIIFIILLPIFIITSIAIKIDSKGKIFFSRKVYGLNGKEFTFYKFRTMVSDAHELLINNENLSEQYNTYGKIKDDPRVTKIGKIIRRKSIDELPQLFNVIIGEMTLIGPRVLGDIELSWYGNYKNYILSVKPGISGLTQVMGRSELSMKKRIQCDLYYIRHRSVLFDLVLMFKTAWVVLNAKGAK